MGQSLRKIWFSFAMMSDDEESEFVGILGELRLESEAESAPPEHSPSTDAEAERRRDSFRNPSHVWLEINYDELGLTGPLESYLELCELFADFGELRVDSLKLALVNHIWYAHDMKRLLKRNFQLSMLVPHSQEWHRVSFDSTLLECVNTHQISRQARYRFRLNLNPGIMPQNCG